MISSDYHVHSDFSLDGGASMETMVRRAIALGFSELAITDHHDYLTESLSEFRLDVEPYMDTFKRLKAQYADRISMRLGLEIGLMPTAGEEIKDLLAHCPAEFVIGSTHDPITDSYYYGTFFEGKTKQSAYTDYFELTLENIRATNGFDVYGHLDYISRYGTYADNSLCYRDYADIIDEILKTLISAGKGLEINTSGYRYGLGTVNPHVDILKRYHELGGEIVTVGSDAHAPEHLGAYFEHAEAALKASGFKAYTLFRKRKPVWRDL